MATKPTNTYRWAQESGGTKHNIVEPSSGHKDEGWVAGKGALSPFFNWLANGAHEWILYLRDAVFVGEAGQPGATITGGSGAGGKGLVVTAGGTNENAIQATPTGDGNAVLTTAGGVGAGVGVTHTGSGRGVLVLQQGSGTGIETDASSGTGYALHCIPNTTKAPVFLGALAADPSSLTDGDFWYNSTAQKFRGRAGGVTVDFH